jgi:hypothetical protein
MERPRRAHWRHWEFVRRSHEFWARLIGEFEAGDGAESHVAFAERHGVGIGSFQRWLYRLRTEGQSPLRRTRRRSGSRAMAGVPWPLVEVQPARVMDGRFEIELPDGRQVRVPDRIAPHVDGGPPDGVEVRVGRAALPPRARSGRPRLPKGRVIPCDSSMDQVATTRSAPTTLRARRERRRAGGLRRGLTAPLTGHRPRLHRVLREDPELETVRPGRLLHA